MQSNEMCAFSSSLLHLIPLTLSDLQLLVRLRPCRPAIMLNKLSMGHTTTGFSFHEFIMPSSGLFALLTLSLLCLPILLLLGIS